MKTQLLSRTLLGIAFCIGIIFTSCDEEGPVIIFGDSQVVSDTSFIDPNIPTPQSKRVLIEDFTGVRCPNCPDAQEEAESIRQDNPGRVVVLSLHPTSFATLTRPFSSGTGDQYDSKYDFRSQFSTDILSMVGNPQGLPTGTIDRKLFNGETERTIPFGKWDGKVNEQLAETTPVNIEVTNSLDESNLELTTTVRLHFTEDVDTTDSYLLSLVIAESEMQDPQEKTGVGIIPDYEHNHVLRSMVTPFSGTLLKETPVRGRVYVKVFKATLEDGWTPEKISTMVFVNKGASDPLVLHVDEAKIK